MSSATSRALRERVAAVEKAAEERKEIAREERKAAKAAALAERTSVVERAEAIVAQDPAKTHWKQSGQTLRDLLDEWKNLQRRGPRLEKAIEDELWKRFSSARTLVRPSPPPVLLAARSGPVRG